MEGKNGYVKKPWGEFQRWTRSEDLILVFVTDRAYFLIPKHQLSNKEWKEALAMLERKLGAV